MFQFPGFAPDHHSPNLLKLQLLVQPSSHRPIALENPLSSSRKFFCQIGFVIHNRRSNRLGRVVVG